MIAEWFCVRGQSFGDRSASMRPRFDDRGMHLADNNREPKELASMRPRFDDRGMEHYGDCDLYWCGASMRPRFDDRGM